MRNFNSTKGQLISECLLGGTNFPKNNERFDKLLPQNLKSGQINKVHALSYNLMILWAT